ncbi:MAG: RNA-directed DNA polymerase [Methylococcales bacterium]
MKLSKEIIKQAYIYVKKYAYHDKLNLFLRQRIAKFEVGEFDDAIEELFDVLNDGKPEEHECFKNWLEEINYHILPKNIERPEKNNTEGLFFTNDYNNDAYITKKINYFINAPIQLHIIEMLWMLTTGSILDKKLSKDSYSNRLSKQALAFREENQKTLQSGEIFKRYIDQYNNWRNKAIDVAIKHSKNGENVAIFSLDLQSFFYHVDINFKDIQSKIDDVPENDLAFSLTILLEKIINCYKKVIYNQLAVSHPECRDKIGLPIGFASSGLLANWYLRDFDELIIDKARPAYYGRYVDDILMVFKRPKLNDDNPIAEFIKEYLESIIEKNDESKCYQIDIENNKIPIQKDKLILHYFNKDHTLAGLEVFKQQLEDRSSAFKLLPDEHINADLNNFAYDVLYDGSANKLRNIVGLTENEIGFSNYLFAHITAYRLCKLNKKDQVLPQLKSFFQGANVLRFHLLWEKVYQYATVLQDQDIRLNFYNNFDEEIDRLSFEKNDIKDNNISKKIRADLKRYNKLAFALCLGLQDIKTYGKQHTHPALTAKFANQFRRSNLIRHHLVALPLANFTNFEGDLTNETAFQYTIIRRGRAGKIKLNLSLSPRFIHFDEWQLFHLHKKLNEDGDLQKWQEDSIDEYKEFSCSENFPVSFASKIENPNLSTLIIDDNQTCETICVGIANIELKEIFIENAIRKDNKPNVSFERQKNLYRILNDALINKVELLVLPEVSIPVSWLPFMVNFARTRQIGLVFGLEHWVVKNIAYNLIIEALPFKTSDKYNSCVITARLKNHYAPNEIEKLESLRLTSPEIIQNGNYNYHKVKWKGLNFTTYNCFELSDITHRALFKSELDLLIACVWNRDTNYYEHILESTVRDLHCYVIQSNASQHGGSCVLQPSKTETKTMIYVKGGENTCILTTKLDIKALREFQFKSKSTDKDKFKPLPPGYDSEAVLKR